MQVHRDDAYGSNQAPIDRKGHHVESANQANNYTHNGSIPQTKSVEKNLQAADSDRGYRYFDDSKDVAHAEADMREMKREKKTSLYIQEWRCL